MEKKIRRFLVSFSVAVVTLTALSLILGKPTTTGNLRPLISFMMLFAPAALVWIAENESIRKICSQYLSFAGIDWRNAATLIICSAVWFTIVPVAVVYIAGEVLGLKEFGRMAEGTVDVFGLFSYNASATSGVISAVAVNIIFALLGGIVAAIVMVFSEIAWRGFLPKYLQCGQYTLPLAVGVLWTLWDMPNLIFAQSFLFVILVIVKNIALSYFLIEVVKKTGSIWISSVVVGIIATGLIVPLYNSGCIYTSAITTALGAITLWIIIRGCMKATNKTIG